MIISSEQTSCNCCIICGGTNSSCPPERKSTGTLIWRIFDIDENYIQNREKFIKDISILPHFYSTKSVHNQVQKL
jgi:hypothetical protein